MFLAFLNIFSVVLLIAGLVIMAAFIVTVALWVYGTLRAMHFAKLAEDALNTPSPTPDENKSDIVKSIYSLSRITLSEFWDMYTLKYIERYKWADKWSDIFLYSGFIVLFVGAVTHVIWYTIVHQ